jgi:hypothetical protein
MSSYLVRKLMMVDGFNIKKRTSFLLDYTESFYKIDPRCWDKIPAWYTQNYLETSYEHFFFGKLFTVVLVAF